MDIKKPSFVVKIDVRRERLGISKPKSALEKCEIMWVSRAAVKYPICRGRGRCPWAVGLFHDLLSETWDQPRFELSPAWSDAAFHSVMFVKVDRGFKKGLSGLIWEGMRWRWQRGCGCWSGEAGLSWWRSPSESLGGLQWSARVRVRSSLFPWVRHATEISFRWKYVVCHCRSALSC